MNQNNLNSLIDLSNIKNAENSSNRSNCLRRRTTISYLESLKSLDNVSTCHLLQENLKEYSNLSAPYFNDKIKQILSKGNTIGTEHKTGVNKINFNNLLPNLACSNTKICQAERSTEKDFQEFLRMSQNKSVETKNFHSIDQNLLNSNMNLKESNEKKETNKFAFKTARDEFNTQKAKIGSGASSGGVKRRLGATRRGVNSKFVSPMLSNEGSESSSHEITESEPTEPIDERLKNIDPRMIELIKSEIMDNGTPVEWDDIAGLEFAKSAVQEAVVLPMLRPDIFTGLRRPPKGILLFGPPGTGKTLIGRCVASRSKSTFFNISASSLTSKWIGEGEKMVRALFTVARCHQPAVIFIDEIDSLLSQRSETEHESSRRLKTEFLVQLDGATTDNEERLLVIGATNRPQELDEAARRRFVKRLYIPLPETKARLQLVSKLMSKEKHKLADQDLVEVAKLSDGYSGADLRNLCSEAAMVPIRSIDFNLIQSIQSAEVRPVNMEDFKCAFGRVKSSVSPDDLTQYIAWDKTFGSGGF